MWVTATSFFCGLLLLVSSHSTSASGPITLVSDSPGHRNLLSVTAELAQPTASSTQAGVVMSEGPIKLQDGKKRGSRKVLDAYSTSALQSIDGLMQAGLVLSEGKVGAGLVLAEGQVKPAAVPGSDGRRLLNAYPTVQPMSSDKTMQAGVVMSEGRVGAGVLVADGRVQSSDIAGSDGRRLLDADPTSSETTMQAGVVVSEGKVMTAAPAKLPIADVNWNSGHRKLLGVTLAEGAGASTSISKERVSAGIIMSEGRVTPNANVIWGEEINKAG